MAIPWQALGDEIVYTIIDETDGAPITLAIQRIEAQCIAAVLKGIAKVCTVDVDPEHVECLRAKRGIEQHRLDRITARVLKHNPIIMAEMPDGSSLIIDGNHRYVKAWMLGKPTIRCIFVPEKVWREYVVTGIPPHLAEKCTKLHSGIF